MRYAISNWIYRDELLRDQLHRLSRFGYEGIELVGEPSKYSIPEVNNLCDEFGIVVSSVLGWSIWGIPGRDCASQDARERSAALDYGKSCVDLANQVNSKTLVIIPSPAGRTTPAGSPETGEDWLASYHREWEYAVDSLSKLTEYANVMDITIALEPINRYETFLVTNVHQALQFIKDVGRNNLKLHLDTFHMNLEEAEIADAIKNAGDLLVNLHISDNNREAPGRGHFDFEEFLRSLREVDYDGFLTLEPVPPGSDPLLMTKMSSNFYLRDLYAEESINYLKHIESLLD